MIEWATPRGIVALIRDAHHARSLASLGRGEYDEAFSSASAITLPGAVGTHQPQVPALRPGSRRSCDPHASARRRDGPRDRVDRRGHGPALASPCHPGGQRGSACRSRRACRQASRKPWTSRESGGGRSRSHGCIWLSASVCGGGEPPVRPGTNSLPPSTRLPASRRDHGPSAPPSNCWPPARPATGRTSEALHRSPLRSSCRGTTRGRRSRVGSSVREGRQRVVSA